MGFRVLGFRVFRVLGFRVLWFRVLGFWVFRVLGFRVEWGCKVLLKGCFGWLGGIFW